MVGYFFLKKNDLKTISKRTYSFKIEITINNPDSTTINLNSVAITYFCTYTIISTTKCICKMVRGGNIKAGAVAKEKTGGIEENEREGTYRTMVE